MSCLNSIDLLIIYNGLVILGKKTCSDWGIDGTGFCHNPFRMSVYGFNFSISTISMISWMVFITFCPLAFLVSG